MYKIIACDLDETLIRSDRTISQEDKDAIAAARALGVHFVPATGRGYESVDVTLAELGLLEAQGEYVISFNGGCVTENAGHRRIHYQGLEREVACRLWERGLAYDICMHVYTPDMCYAFRYNDDERAFQAGRMALTPVDYESLDFLEGQPIVKLLYQNTNIPYLQQIECEITDITDGLDLSYSSNRYLEFNPRGVTKGAGLLRLADLLGVDHADTIAIGDNWNDYSMIRDAGMGAAVANAVEDMKPLC
ncbi:MAG: HAD-IIB family hydrolase, partial [Coriobacteriales bacterium]|nr:HAD-IIB family hydrolase [Coriobacteriales bacterium]